MRFAYIDSHGNEVPIPSVDALALRIELGAIGPETQLFDAQADRWGPASSHEIFHTLARDSQAEGFVAPPPPVAPPPAPAPPPPVAKPKPKPTPRAKREAEPAPPATALDMGLTLAEPAPEPPKMAEPAAPPAQAFDLPLDLAPPLEAPSSGRGTVESGAGAPGDSGGAFDYGDLSSGLQLEDGPIEVSAAPAGFGGGGGVDAPMQFGGPPAGGGDFQLEEPMSSFRPDAPPGWMAGPTGGSETMDFSAAPAEAEAPAAPPVAAPAREKRAPRDRPSAPKFKKQRNIAGPIIFVVLALALGVGGYVGWPLLQARLNPPPPPTRPAVVMPAIPEDLLPQMRSLAEGAIADAIAEVDAGSLAGAPTEPDQQWLAGTYLADASQFPGVEAFWTGIGTLMDAVRAGEWRLYHDKLAARLTAAGIAADTAAMLLERADSGFVAAEAGRQATYDTVDESVQAALDLHGFLIANEANIEYRPATSSTADPILEAVPSSPAIGDRMLELVDRVTDALGDLGSVERVSRPSLAAALTARLQQVGIQ
jgi:hypothetical protein